MPTDEGLKTLRHNDPNYESMLKERREKREKAERAAKHIAALVFTDFDIEVTPEQVSSFIKTRWDRIAPLAHTVHEAPDMTKVG